MSGTLSAKKSETRSSKAGLQFPVGRVHRLLKNRKDAKRIGSTAPIYLAAALEYMTAEVLELAGRAAQANNKARIGPRHITLAVRNDEELNQFLSGVSVAAFGAPLNIQALLCRKNAKNAKSKTEGKTEGKTE
tara:strand:+ start:180 stop:578 length:399 start_codon:yes stop_codon:yes gene_type:complete